MQKQLGDILAHKQKQQNRQDLLKDARKNEIKQVNQRMIKDTNIDTHFLYDMFFEGNYLQNSRQKTIISEISNEGIPPRQGMQFFSCKSVI